MAKIDKADLACQTKPMRMNEFDHEYVRVVIRTLGYEKDRWCWDFFHGTGFADVQWQYSKKVYPTLSSALTAAAEYAREYESNQEIVPPIERTVSIVEQPTNGEGK